MRPFFSLVIPCYNDGRYQEGEYLDRLLDNLCSQNLKKEELEVILADDHSPVPFNNIIEKYCDRLDLKYCLTDYNFAPGNTRQCGSKLATGIWLCFADHDDSFYPDCFTAVKQAIKDHHPQHIISTDFNKVDVQGNIVEEFRGKDLSNWIHGKFYNLDNFWNKYGIEFPKDLKTHEDIAVGVQVDCILKTIGKNNLFYFRHLTYMWLDNEESISNSNYIDKLEDSGTSSNFLERAYPDFLRSRWGQYINMYEKGFLEYHELIELSIQQIRTSWIMLNTWENCGHLEYLKRNEKEFHNYLAVTLLVAKVNLTFVKTVIGKYHSDMKDQIDKTAKRYSKMKLFDWLEYIYRLESIDEDQQAIFQYYNSLLQ